MNAEMDDGKEGKLALAKYFKDGRSFDVALSTWALAHSIPIPPSIIERVRVGAGRLIDGFFNYADNGIQRLNARANFNANIQQDVVAALAQDGKLRLSADEPQLSVEVARSFLNEHGLKLANRRSIVEAAFEEFRTNPPTHDESVEANLDNDWLNSFADVASQKSDPDMQKLMGKVLAGEIRRPGTFSQLSINILSTLSHSAAKKFESLCSVSFNTDNTRYISTDMFPEFLSKGIPEIGFTYQDLLLLRNYQLLAVETGSNYECKVGSALLLTSADQVYIVRPQMPDAHYLAKNARKFNVALFSLMGSELAQLISVNAPDWFDSKLRSTFSQPSWDIVN